MGFPTAIGKLLIKDQASSWGTAETSFSDATDLMSCEPFVPGFREEALEQQNFRGGWHAHKVVPGSREGAEVSVSQVLQGLSFTTPTADPGDSPVSRLLKSVLGSSASIGYAAAIESSGQAVDSVKYPDGSLATTWSGMAVLLPVVASPSGRQIAWAKTIDTASTPDALVPYLDLLGVPTNSGVSLGGRTHWLSLSQPTPFTAQVHLGEAGGNATVRLRDGVCTSAKLTLAANAQPKAEFGMKFGRWDIAGSWTPGQFADAFPELPMLDEATGARVEMPDIALVHQPQIEIEMTADMQPVRKLGAFAKWVCVSRQVTITVTSVVDTYSEIQHPGDLLTQGLQVDLCTVPGRAAGFFAPRPQVQSVSADENLGGLLVRKTVLGCSIETGATAGANAANAPFAISLF